MPLDRHPWLTLLARRKLGEGAIIRVSESEWIAERTTRGGQRTRVTGKTRDILVWFLEQMPDLVVKVTG